ncbi:hypothetical protein [Sphingobium xenophagum]
MIIHLCSIATFLAGASTKSKIDRSASSNTKSLPAAMLGKYAKKWGDACPLHGEELQIS